MVSSKAGRLTNPQEGDVENNSTKDKLGAASKRKSRLKNRIGIEDVYFLGLPLGLVVQLTCFELIMTLIIMPEIWGPNLHVPIVPVVALWTGLGAIYCMFNYFGFLACSSLFLLLAPFAKPRANTTVTLGMQIGYSLTEEESSLTEEHFPRKGETTSYDLALLILWIVLSAIIQVYTMKRLNKMQNKNEESRARPAVKVYTIKPLNNKLMEQKKSEDSTELPDQPCAYFVV